MSLWYRFEDDEDDSGFKARRGASAREAGEKSCGEWIEP